APPRGSPPIEQRDPAGVPRSPASRRSNGSLLSLAVQVRLAPHGEVVLEGALAFRPGIGAEDQLHLMPFVRSQIEPRGEPATIPALGIDVLLENLVVVAPFRDADAELRAVARLVPRLG